MIYSINLNFLNKNNINVFKKNNTYKIITTNFNKINCIFTNSKNTEIFIDTETNNLVLKTLNKEKKIFNHVNLLNNISKKPYNKHYEKIKFSGKGFRLSSIQSKKVLETFFGHSHIIYIYTGKILIKRLKKYKYIFWTEEKYLIKKLRKIIKTIKPINLYTLRGLRPTKIKLIKRKGRKSPNL